MSLNNMIWTPTLNPFHFNWEKKTVDICTCIRTLPWFLGLAWPLGPPRFILHHHSLPHSVYPRYNRSSRYHRSLLRTRCVCHSNTPDSNFLCTEEAQSGHPRTHNQVAQQGSRSSLLLWSTETHQQQKYLGWRLQLWYWKYVGS